MSTISGNTNATQLLWQRFHARADGDANGVLSKEELLAAAPDAKSKEKAEAIFAGLDGDGDGGISVDELPTNPLEFQMLGPLLSAQEYREASAEDRAVDDQRVVASMFERADTDGDGVLSKEELNAERMLQTASWLDEGAVRDHAFMIRNGADKNALTPDDFSVARMLPAATLKPVNLEDIPLDIQEIPPEIRERLEEIKAQMTKDSPEVPSVDRSKFHLSLEEKLQQAELTSAFMSRLFAQLNLSVGGEPVDFTA